MKSITQPAGNAGSVGGMTVSFPGLIIYHLTLSSANMVEGVNLSAISVITGDWVRFIPSYLPEVGPSGTDADMLVAGAFELSSPGNDANVSMIIQATTSGGSFGEVAPPDAGSGQLRRLAHPRHRSGVSGGGISATPGQDELRHRVDHLRSRERGFQSVPSRRCVDRRVLWRERLGPAPAPLAEVLRAWVFDEPVHDAIRPALLRARHDRDERRAAGSYTLVVDVEVGTGSLTLFIPVEVNPPVYSAAG